MLMKLLVNRLNHKMKLIGSCKVELNLSKQNSLARLTNEGIYREAKLRTCLIRHRINRNSRRGLTIFMEFQSFKWSRIEADMMNRMMITAKIQKNNNLLHSSSKSMKLLRSSIHGPILSWLNRRLRLKAHLMEEDILTSSSQSCWWGLRILLA